MSCRQRKPSMEQTLTFASSSLHLHGRCRVRGLDGALMLIFACGRHGDQGCRSLVAPPVLTLVAMLMGRCSKARRFLVRELLISLPRASKHASTLQCWANLTSVASHLLGTPHHVTCGEAGLCNLGGGMRSFAPYSRACSATLHCLFGASAGPTEHSHSTGEGCMMRRA